MSNEPVSQISDAQRALNLLKAQDERTQKIHDMLEDIREQILEMPVEHRPAGLFNNMQHVVYAMRGRVPLMSDAAITSPLLAQAQGVKVPNGKWSDREAIYEAAIAAYEAATPPNYRYSAIAMVKAIDAAIAKIKTASLDLSPKPLEITEEMVERAMNAFYHDAPKVLRPITDDELDTYTGFFEDMRATLTAALELDKQPVSGHIQPSDGDTK